MTTYRTLHTPAGLAMMAAAQANPAAIINLVEMAVGDGNGNPVDPDVLAAGTGLVRERYRAAINSATQHPGEPNRWTVELVIPVSVGGFVMREAGVFDSNGTLFAVANLPDAQKPAEADGAYSDTVVRMEFLVTNAEDVTFLIDPSAIVATRTWIMNNFTSAQLLPGGNTGQVLTKQSNADGDVDWEDPDAANVTVDMIEERQTLAADQTQIDLAVCTTRGLAVYIEGVRINQGPLAAEWEKNPADEDASIILGKSWPAGTKVLMAQNEPSNMASPPLERDRNLADVPDKDAARNHLGVYSKEESDLLAPAGQVAYFATPTPPNGWLKANGALVSRVAYARLFAALGESWGAGDGFNTFQLPDLRGEFVRGHDDGRGVDIGRVFGSVQGQSGGLATVESRYSISGVPEDRAVTVPQTGFPSAWINTGDRTSAYDVDLRFKNQADMRPRNVALLACIKF
ncbi:phage tail protein [Halopseudomonas aestusnigri]|uniref:phage tail-collar fiber domain-containing protein n=1 Tax=Halopseudomonas aestusnigri TaxID=857252 RepID=UPI001E4237A6|nr:phage tail protein [Halopseudomonas aestusnigri]UGV31532.1 phage tail protein [Halopseudomonas aestusnigri]